MKIGVIGAGGRMGRMLIAEILAHDEARLGGAVEGPGNQAVGRDAGVLAGVAWMGEHDWYGEGADYLTGIQAKSGSWTRDGDGSGISAAALDMVQLRKVWVTRAMVARVIVHAGPGQDSLGRDIAADVALRPLVPVDVEGRQLGKEIQAVVRQMVVNPPGERTPIGTLGIALGEPRHNNTGGRTHKAFRVASVPNVMGEILLVGGAV